MKTNEILKKLRSLSLKKGWSVQLRQTDQVRFKAPGEKAYRRNPLSALAGELEDVPNLRWKIPGQTLGLNPNQIEDFHLACDFRWFRPQLRMKILKACGVRDPKFVEAFEFAESVLPKRKLEKVLANLSSDEREALETATVIRSKKRIEEILKKYC